MRINGRSKSTEYPRATFTDAELRSFEIVARKRERLQSRGSLEAHKLGVLGEAAVLRVVGLPLLFCEEFDHGTDLYLGNWEVDVKTTTVQNGNLMMYDIKDFRADLAVLASPVGKTEPNSVDVIGWTTRDEFENLSRPVWLDKNRGERRLMSRENLLPMSSLIRVLDGMFCERYTQEQLTFG